MGLVAGMDMTDNVMLRSYKSNKGIFVDRKSPKELAEKLIEELEIVTPEWIRLWEDFPAEMCRKYFSAVRSPVSRPC